MGTARAPVAGSGALPACSASVSEPGSEWLGMGSPLILWLGDAGHCGTAPRPEVVRRLWATIEATFRPAGSGIAAKIQRTSSKEAPHESQRHPPRQGQHAFHRRARALAG